MTKLSDNKPVIDVFIPKYLDGDMRQAAEDFVAWLRENELYPVWSSAHTWKASHKGDIICIVQVPCTGYRDTWRVSLQLRHADRYKDIIAGEGLRDIILGNIACCVYADGQPGIGCSRGRPCAGGEDRTVLGEVIKGVCMRTNRDVKIIDPGETEIAAIKRLIGLERSARDEGSEPIQAPAQSCGRSDEPSVDLRVDRDLVDFMRTKPKLEAGVAKSLEGEKLQNILDFSAWLRANKFAPAYADWNYYKINIRGHTVCGIKLGCGGFEPGRWLKNHWRLSFWYRIYNEDNQLLSDREKEIIWSNVKSCNDCGGACRPGHRCDYCGREFERVCGMGVEFWNPGVEEMECAKKLLLSKREYDVRAAR